MASRSSLPPIFPWRYGMFLALLAISAPLVLWLPWYDAMMAGFDVSALAFLIAVAPLINDDTGTMRRNAERNDANRELMLLLTAIVSIVILIAVGVAVSARGGPKPLAIALLLCTLALAWLFTNMIYALHYAHIFYVKDASGKDSGGIGFPETKEPRYWDFIYFAFTLGMTFQTSDVTIHTVAIRKIVTLHSLAAFVFNLGIIAFTINALGGA